MAYSSKTTEKVHDLKGHEKKKLEETIKKDKAARSAEDVEEDP